MELLLCFVITFAILNFVLSVREISYKKVFYKYKTDSIMIISLNSDDFSEIYLRHRVELIKNSGLDVCKVVLVDNGLTSEQHEICQNIIKNNDMIKLVNINEIYGFVEALLK